MAYVDILIAFVLGTVSITLVRLAWKLFRYDDTEYQKTRARYPSFPDVVWGKARVRRDTVPDGRIRAGIVYNKNADRIEPNGKLSNDVVDQVLTR